MAKLQHLCYRRHPEPPPSLNLQPSGLIARWALVDSKWILGCSFSAWALKVHLTDAEEVTYGN